MKLLVFAAPISRKVDATVLDECFKRVPRVATLLNQRPFPLSKITHSFESTRFACTLHALNNIKPINAPRPTLRRSLQHLPFTHPRLPRRPNHLPLLHENPAPLSSFRHVHAPDPNACCRAQRKQERKPCPVISGVVDYGLHDIGPDDAGRSVRDAEEAEEHVFVPPRREFGHHGLAIGVVGGLEEAEDYVVEVEFPEILFNGKKREGGC